METGGRANADQIIHIHSDTINAYGIVLAHHLGDDHLGSHPISGNGQPNTPNIENVRKVANVKSDSADASTEGPRGADLPDEALQSYLFSFRVDAGCTIRHEMFWGRRLHSSMFSLVCTWMPRMFPCINQRCTIAA